MSNSSRSLLLALFGLLALFNTLALAAPTSGSHVLAARHPNAGSASKKRYDNARLTYYDAGQNACGWYDSDSDYVSTCPRKLVVILHTDWRPSIGHRVKSEGSLPKALYRCLHRLTVM